MGTEKTVLVAEDNEDIRELVCLQLRDMGLRVLSACNGREAMEQALQARPDLVLMDMNMPVMTGFDAVRALRAGGYGAPIVGLTAYQEGPEGELALACGCNRVLHKPIRARDLREGVGAVLGTGKETAT